VIGALSAESGFLGLPRYSIGSPSGRPGGRRLQRHDHPRPRGGRSGNRLALYSLITGRVSQVQTGKVVDPATLTYSDKVARENWTSAWFTVYS